MAVRHVSKPLTPRPLPLGEGAKETPAMSDEQLFDTNRQFTHPYARRMVGGSS
jgi:hypothetical protein